MIIAGTQANSLAQFLSNSGVDVEYCFNSVQDAKSVIENSIIKIDKLLYVYQPSIMNIRSDMSLMLRLLTDNFFSIREIVFIQKKDNTYSKVEAYVAEVVSECNKVLDSGRRKSSIMYSPKPIDGELTFQNVSSALFGITENENFKNSILNVYRYEKDNEATTAYVPKNTKDYRVEPFNFSRIQNDDKSRENLIRTDSGNLIVDDNNNLEVKLNEPPQFDSLNNRDTIFKNLFIITGEPCSGKSVWSCILSASAIYLKQKVLILDFSYAAHVKEELESNYLDFSHADVSGYLKNGLDDSKLLHVITPAKSEFDIRYDFLQVFLSLKQRSNYNKILILTDSTDLDHCMSITYTILNKVCYCAIPIQSNLKYLDRAINTCIKVCPVYVFLNSILVNKSSNAVDTDSLKNRYGQNLKFVSTKPFTDFNVTGVFCTKILEGE